MDLPAAKLTKEEQKLAVLEKHRANEIVHSLVVKIISWKAGLQEGAAISKSNKISPEEWDTYKKYIYAIYKVEGVEKAQKKLDEAEAAIRKNGGFH